jgi:hypothetical protein
MTVFLNEDIVLQPFMPLFLCKIQGNWKYLAQGGMQSAPQYQGFQIVFE